MSNIVLLLPTKVIEEIKEYYKEHCLTRQAPGVIFAAKLADTAITVYKSGKVMFQGSGATREAARWGNVTSTGKNSTAKGDQLPEHFSNLSVIGSDETGTGDYFGPITVAAVYVPADKIPLVQELGVKDSKLLTDDYMRKIAPDLMKACTHSILTLRNHQYNALQAKGYSQGKLKALLHNQALKHVVNKLAPIEPQYILIDQFAARDTYYRYLQKEQEIVRKNVLFSTKAESLHVAVATASILARYAFLKEMDRLSQLVGYTLQKGAGSKVDVMAAKIWKEKGEDTLRSIAKWHFANTEKARKLLR